MARRAADTQNPLMNPALNPAFSIKLAERASCAHGVWMIPGSKSNARKFRAAKLILLSCGQRERLACCLWTSRSGSLDCSEPAGGLLLAVAPGVTFVARARALAVCTRNSRAAPPPPPVFFGLNAVMRGVRELTLPPFGAAALETRTRVGRAPKHASATDMLCV
jgi:hypothetical protein